MPQGHDGRHNGEKGDGIEVGKVRDEEVNGGEDHGEVGAPHGLAVEVWEVVANDVMELLEAVSPGDHVNNAGSNLHHQLLWDHNPKPELFAESVLP